MGFTTNIYPTDLMMTEYSNRAGRPIDIWTLFATAEAEGATKEEYAEENVVEDVGEEDVEVNPPLVLPRRPARSQSL
jgi:hypothetical protein